MRIKQIFVLGLFIFLTGCVGIGYKITKQNGEVINIGSDYRCFAEAGDTSLRITCSDFTYGNSIVYSGIKFEEECAGIISSPCYEMIWRDK